MPISRDTIDTILKDFDENYSLFGDFKEKLRTLISELIAGKGSQIHSVTARKKERISLERKLSKDSADYTKLVDITDIVGMRIITYFSDDVDALCDLIESEFEIDKENSI